MRIWNLTKWLGFRDLNLEASEYRLKNKGLSLFVIVVKTGKIRRPHTHLEYCHVSKLSGEKEETKREVRRHREATTERTKKEGMITWEESMFQPDGRRVRPPQTSLFQLTISLPQMCELSQTQCRPAEISS